MNKQSIAFIIMGALTVLFSGCGSTGFIVSEAESVRTAVQKSNDSQTDALNKVMASNNTLLQLLYQQDLAQVQTALQLRQAYIEAGRCRVLEQFDDAAFRQINLGFEIQLSADGNFRKMQEAERVARVNLDRAILEELRGPGAMDGRSNRIAAQQAWERASLIIVELKHELRGRLIAALAKKREEFRTAAQVELDRIESDGALFPIATSVSRTDLSAADSKYFEDIRGLNADIDRALVEVIASLRYESSPQKLGSKYLEGVLHCTIHELETNSLGAATLAGVVKKDDSAFVAKISAAITALAAKAQSDVSQTSQAAVDSAVLAATNSADAQKS